MATRLATELIDRGYSVWLDSWEILVGHNIVDEVFRGITESEFVIVVLSPAACKSQWVQEEFTTARVAEIEQRQVTVLPMIIENCEVPESLKNKRFANFTQSWENGLRELTIAIDLHRASEATKSQSNRSKKPETFDKLNMWRGGVLSQPPFKILDKETPYKDILIGPPDHSEIEIVKEQLLSLVEGSTVQLSGWGGPLFPYDHYPSREETRLKDGVRFVDNFTWPYRSHSFHFWQIDKSLRFLHREHLDEDFVLDESNEPFIKGKLSREWALIDIVRPLLFARNLITHEKRVGTLAIKYFWGGLEGRALVQLNRNRVGFFRDYICRENEWVYETEIDLNTDLQEEARKATLNLFWLFAWDPEPVAIDVINRNLESLINGAVPS